MSKALKLTQKRVRELLNYDPKTGVFTRKIQASTWNTVKTSKYGTVGAGRISELGYVMISVDGHRYNAGCLAWLYTNGVWPDRIRYANGIGTDNRIDNIVSVDVDEGRERELTSQRLKEVIHYDPDTGIFTWVKNTLASVIGKRAGGIHALGYRSIGIDYKRYLEHNLAWLYMTGKMPKRQIDHINRDRADNRWENLRDVSRAENNVNKGLCYSNTSGYPGVTLRRRKIGARTPYWAYLHVDTICRDLGRYDTIAEARVARLLAEIAAFGHTKTFDEARDTSLPGANEHKLHLERTTIDVRGEQVDCLIAYNHHGVPFHIKSVKTVKGILSAGIA